MSRRSQRAAQEVPAVVNVPVKKAEKRKSDHIEESGPLLPQRHLIPGQVFVSGSNEAGQLGLGDLSDNNKYRPKRVTFFDELSITAVFCGGMHTIALGRCGRIWSWGCNDDKALGRDGTHSSVDSMIQGDELVPGIVEMHGVRVVDAACGDSVSLVLAEDGSCYSWGTFRDSRGLFGHTPTAPHQTTPQRLALPPLCQIACGTNHALGLTLDHKVFSWGVGEQGQLGRKIVARHVLTASLLPRRMDFKARSKPDDPDAMDLDTNEHDSAKKNECVGVYCGSFCSFLKFGGGDVYAFGLDNYGQLGVGGIIGEPSLLDDFSPRKVQFTPSLSSGRIAQISAGEHHSLLLTTAGKIFACGRNDDGQLGVDSAVPLSTFTELSVGNMRQVGAACGGYFSFAVSKEEEDNLWMWGYGESGQLAGGSVQGELIGESFTKPENIDLKGRRVLMAGAGGQHSVFLIAPKEDE